MSKKKKPYWEMTTDESAEATSEFDEEGVGATFRDMTPEQEKAWRAAVDKRKRGGRLPEEGKKTISLAVHAGLLKRIDALAKKRRISRERLVAESLEAMLAQKSLTR